MIDRRELFARLTGAFAAVPFVGRMAGSEPDAAAEAVGEDADLLRSLAPPQPTVVQFGEPMPAKQAGETLRKAGVRMLEDRAAEVARD